MPRKLYGQVQQRIFNDKKHIAVTAVMCYSRFLENIYSLLYEKVIVFDDLSDFSDELKNNVRNFLTYN